MSNLEALSALLTDPRISAGEQYYTIEFHWYAAEEAGLKGSLDVFNEYVKDNETVLAMLQQDMTGFGVEPMGLIVDDFVNAPLTNYMRKIIDTVSPTYYPYHYLALLTFPYYAQRNGAQKPSAPMQAGMS
jgi:leucyl aminopeptidase